MEKSLSHEIVALIPVREGSERIKGKNFISFVDGSSLLELKSVQLKKSRCFKHIYVSSDSKQAEKIALDNGVEFLPRAAEMCQNNVYWAEVVEHIMETIPGNPIVTWALTTSPLFNDFNGVVRKFLEVQGKYDSLVTVFPKKLYSIG